MSLRVLFFETPDNPYFNLAFEEALAKVCSAKRECFILRIWRNRRASVIGYFRNVEDEINTKVASSEGVAIVRRFTGGGAVFHDMGNINYTLVVKHPKIAASLDYVYGNLLEGIVEALRNLGLTPERRNINDIVVNGWKVSGVAASLRWNTIFLHGSLLINTDLNLLRKVLIIPPRKQPYRNVDPVKYHVNNLSEIVGRRVSYWEIVNLIIDGYSKTLSKESFIDKPEPLELEVAKMLYEERYSKFEWNFKRKSLLEFTSLERKISEILNK